MNILAFLLTSANFWFQNLSLSHVIEVPFNPYGDLDRYLDSKTSSVKEFSRGKLSHSPLNWLGTIFDLIGYSCSSAPHSLKFCSKKAKTSYFDRYARPIPKHDLQR